MSFFRRLFSSSSKNRAADPLWHAVNALIRARNYGELWTVLEKHPELLKPKADKLLIQRIADAQKRGDHDVEQLLTERQKLLRRGRKIGMKAAFVEMEGIQHALPPLWRAVGGFLRIHSNSELWTYVEKNPSLLSHQADQLLGEHIVIAQEKKEGSLKRLLETRRNLLRLMRRAKESPAYVNCPKEILDKFVQAQKLAIHYSNSGDRNIFDEAVAHWRELINQSGFSSLPPDFVVDVLVNSAHLLMYEYQIHHNQADLDQALANWQKAVALIPSDSPELPVHLRVLADGFKIRYELTGHPEDLEQTVNALKKVVEIIPPQDATRIAIMNTLGLNLRIQYQQSRNLFDLEGSIHFGHEAVNATSEGSPNRPSYLNNLGNALMARYEHIKKARDLEEAIRTYRLAVEGCSPQFPGYSLYVNNLRNSLVVHYEQTHLQEDKKEIEQLDQIIKEAPPASIEEATAPVVEINESAEGKQTKDKTSQEAQQMISILELAIASIGIFFRPRYTLKKLYNSPRATPVVLWYFVMVILSIGLSAWGQSFHFERLTNYFSWPPFGLALIALYTIICACVLFFGSLKIVDDKAIPHGLWVFAGIMALLSLSIVNKAADLGFGTLTTSLNGAVLQFGTAAFIAAAIIPIAFSTSLYSAAADTNSSQVTSQHIIGLTNGLLFISGILIFVYKLLLVAFTTIVSSISLAEIQFIVMIPVLLMFLYFLDVLLTVGPIPLLHKPRLLTTFVFNFLNIIPNLVTAFLVWTVTSAVYNSISAGGSLGFQLIGVVLAVVVFLVVGAVFAVIVSLIFYGGGTDLIYKYFWRVRVDISLLAYQVDQPDNDWQIMELYSAVFGKEAQLFPRDRAKLQKKLEAHLTGFAKDYPDKALHFINRLPIHTYDMDLYLPVVKHVLELSIHDKIGASERIFDKLYSAGVLKEIAPKLHLIPLFHYYYLLVLNQDDELGFILEKVTATSSSLLKAVNLRELYEALYMYFSVATFKDIVNLSLKEIPKIDFSLNNTRQLEEPFNGFLDVINDLRKSEKVVLEHKLPYFANSLEILVKTISLAGKLPQPHQRVFSTVAQKWQSILTTELMSLKGRAELKMELKLKKFYAFEKLVIPIEILNTGNSVAEDIKVKLISNTEHFKILDFDLGEVDILPPKESVVVNFEIAPLSSDKIRIAVEATFSDFDAAGKIHKFGDMIEIVTEKENLAESEDSYEVLFNNPYIAGRPIHNPKMFFGRHEIVATMEQSLRGRHQDNVIVLQGERRSGKSSILYYLCSKFKDDYVPVLIDAQDFLSRGTEYFLWQIASRIQEKLKEQGIRIPEPNLEMATKKAEVWLRHEFLGSVRQALGSRRLLILFDEFDSLQDRINLGKLDKEIFPFFRSLMQHESWMAFVFSGTYRLEEMVTEYWSILFNIAIYLRLDFLSAPDARQLITEPVAGQLEYDEFAIERILAVTSCHPYFIQLICFSLYNLQLKHRKTYITSQDVDRVIDEVIKTQTHTQFIWKDTSSNEHLVLTALGQEAKQELDVITPVMIRSVLASHNINISSADVNDALTKLTRKGIISTDTTATQFHFRVDLIRRWLRLYKNLGAVIDEEKRNVK